MPDSRPLKILVADDTVSDRSILEAIVRKEGHEVVTATNGLEAVAVFERERPDLVLLDALMPMLDGFDAARKIKEFAGDDLVPIIFLTSLSDTESLVRCLDAGGDDFLSKPYNRIILNAKINAFSRMRDLHRTMIRQRDHIAKNNERLLQEQKVAKHVFDNVAHSGCLDAENIRYLMSSLAVFNGDVLLAAMRPSGNMIVLLGDFTGHGLPAAIGAMPLASTFYSMVAKGFSMTDILAELNAKLKAILPVGIFCCAVVMDINYRKKRVKIWNGGLPDCFVLHHRDRRVSTVKSTHLPLGVLSGRAFKDQCELLELENDDRIFVWSDGIHEARNPKGDMFGEQRLHDIFAATDDPTHLFDRVIDAVQQFVGPGEKDDDLSLLEIRMADPEHVNTACQRATRLHADSEIEWSLHFKVNPTSLRVFDPLPLLMNVLKEVPSLRGFNSQIYTVLAELYANALEHGVLGLDSSVKTTPEGFAQYYRLRQERLNLLEEGFVDIKLTHLAQDDGGVLTIRLEDSGAGFDFSNHPGGAGSSLAYSGRGIDLVENLCSRVAFSGTGNIVEADFCWKNED